MKSIDVRSETVAAVRLPIALDALDSLHRALEKLRPGRTLYMRQSGDWLLFEERPSGKGSRSKVKGSKVPNPESRTPSPS